MRSPSSECRQVRHLALGFTLIELMVVIAILGVMATAIMTGVTRGLVRARESQCAANLRQLSLGAIAYATANRGWMPPHGGTNTLAMHLADYVGTTSVTQITVWRCPADTRGNMASSYGVNRLHLTAAQALNGWPITSIPRPARTVMMGESGGSASPVWEIRYEAGLAVREVGVEFRHGEPRANQSVPAASASVFRQSRANLAFYDGHVESVTVHSLSVTNWHPLY